MKKVLLACLGAFCLLTASAFADEGLPSTGVLDDMGLSGMQILSDSDALAVRGKGWLSQHPPLPHAGGKKPWVAAGGISIAGVKQEKNAVVDGLAVDGNSVILPTSTHLAGSINFYLAEGKYKAGGENASYASKTTTHITVRAKDGWVATNSRIRIKAVGAGGSSSGYAF